MPLIKIKFVRRNKDEAQALHCRLCCFQQFAHRRAVYLDNSSSKLYVRDPTTGAFALVGNNGIAGGFVLSDLLMFRLRPPAAALLIPYSIA